MGWVCLNCGQYLKDNEEAKEHKSKFPSHVMMSG